MHTATDFNLIQAGITPAHLNNTGGCHLLGGICFFPLFSYVEFLPVNFPNWQMITCI
jgi:hypothetical protein